MKYLPLITLFILMDGYAQSERLAGSQFAIDTIARRLKVRTSEKQTYFGGKDSPSMTYRELYDTNGRIISLLSYNSNLNSVPSEVTYTFNKKGQLVQEQSISPPDTVSNICTYRYNSKGNLARNGFGKIKYKYDKGGRIIESREKTAKPSDFVIHYNYDSLGRLIAEEHYIHSYSSGRYEWIYNEKGQVGKEISSFYLSGSKLPVKDQENTFVYDENGLIIEEYQIQVHEPAPSKNRVYKYSYTFFP